jgi:hypothetical protein
MLALLEVVWVDDADALIAPFDRHDWILKSGRAFRLSSIMDRGLGNRYRGIPPTESLESKIPRGQKLAREEIILLEKQGTDF